MTVSAGAYNATTNTVTVTVTGGGTGELVLYETFTGAPAALSRIVARIPGYDGTSEVIVDRFPSPGSRVYLAFVDDTANGTDTVTVTLTDQWIISLSDETSLKVCAVRDGREQWRGRRRRGWWGNVVGQVRSVAVADVAMGAREGRLSVLVTADQIPAMDNLLKEGIVCIRGPEPRTGLFALILDYQDRPAGSGDDPWWVFDIQYAQVDPAGFLGPVPS